MGFLDRLVGDMLKESVGYDVGKITRMIGGKNLLLLGAGAALAGSAGFGQGPSDGPSTWQDPPRQGAAPPSSTPPLPPLPSSGPTRSAPPPLPTAGLPATPPLPPIPSPAAHAGAAHEVPAPDASQQATVEATVSTELTYALVRSMVAAALADGHLDDKEKEMILARLDESDLDAGQRQQVHRDLVIPPTQAELAALTDSFDEREAMYRFAALVILTDGDVSELERSWLDRLAVAFAFDGERRRRLEDEVRAA